MDGDNIRHGLNKDLGFTELDRVENIRRIGEVSSLFVDAGLIVLTAFISPFKSDRQIARSLVNYDEFLEVFVDSPLKVCEKRDPKGLYKKARSGSLKNFTGIDSPYEEPSEAEIHIDTNIFDVNNCCDKIINYLILHGFIGEKNDIWFNMKLIEKGFDCNMMSNYQHNIKIYSNTILKTIQCSTQK